MLWSLATPRIRARLPFKRVNPTHLPLTPSLVETVDKWPLHPPSTDQRTNGKQKTENRKCKTGRIDPFSVFRFRFPVFHCTFRRTVSRKSTLSVRRGDRIGGSMHTATHLQGKGID